MVKSKNKRCSR